MDEQEGGVAEVEQWRGGWAEIQQRIGPRFAPLTATVNERGWCGRRAVC